MKVDRLVTPRLILRRPEPGDLTDLHAALSHPAAMRYWATPEHTDLAQTERWLAAMIARVPDQGSDDFLIQYQGRVIGKAGGWVLPEIGFLLHPDHWGKGLAHEAMSCVIPYLFGT